MQLDLSHGIYRSRPIYLGDAVGPLSTIASAGSGIGRAADAVYAQVLAEAQNYRIGGIRLISEAAAQAMAKAAAQKVIAGSTDAQAAIADARAALTAAQASAETSASANAAAMAEASKAPAARASAGVLQTPAGTSSGVLTPDGQTGVASKLPLLLAAAAAAFFAMKG